MTEINDLWSKDPRELSEEDLDTLVAHFRQERLKFMTEAPKPTKARASSAAAVPASASLEDLLGE